MKKLALILALLPAAASAQQPDAAFLQRAVNVLQTQRNQALDAQAVAEARMAGIADDLAKANAKIAELEKAAAPAPDAPK